MVMAREYFEEPDEGNIGDGCRLLAGIIPTAKPIPRALGLPIPKPRLDPETPVTHRTCAICEAVFVFDHHKQRQTTCSEECGDERRRRRLRGRYGK